MGAFIGAQIWGPPLSFYPKHLIRKKSRLLELRNLNRFFPLKNLAPRVGRSWNFFLRMNTYSILVPFSTRVENFFGDQAGLVRLVSRGVVRIEFWTFW